MVSRFFQVLKKVGIERMKHKEPKVSHGQQRPSQTHTNKELPITTDVFGYDFAELGIGADLAHDGKLAPIANRMRNLAESNKRGQMSLREPIE